MASFIVCLHANNLEIVCHIENSNTNTRQSKKLIICLLKDDPLDNEEIAIDVQIMANMPNDIVTKPMAISVSTANLKIEINPAVIAKKAIIMPISFFI